MKKNIFFSFLFLFLTIASQAQEAKRYILLEHFTNTVCGICASRNPAFFNTIAQYPTDIHHIAYHPPVPYTSCVLYQHNTTENAARANYYNIFGTPKVFLNGSPTGPGSLITDADITAELGKTSSLGIAVSETSGNDREVSVDIKTFGTAPSGDLKLYVAVVEGLINYNSPNGESQHHNVFRQFLANGVDFSPAADGQTASFTYNYSIDSDWQANEIYVLAYVQNDATKEIINSGNRFDEALPTSNNNLNTDVLTIRVSPNPVSDQLYIDLGDIELTKAELSLQNVTGQEVWSAPVSSSTLDLDVSAMASGLYFLRLQQGGMASVAKVIIQ